jgi:hypothetical protein
MFRSIINNERYFKICLVMGNESIEKGQADYLVGVLLLSHFSVITRRQNHAGEGIFRDAHKDILMTGSFMP